jgi:glycosyltransferase involved in cell wall biosynthesis
MDSLQESENYEVFLIYWKREKSLFNKPFSTKVKNSNIKSIALSDPRGNLLRRTYLNFIFILRSYKFISESNPEIIHAQNLDMLILTACYKVFYSKTHLVLDLLDTRLFFTRGIWKEIALFAIKKTSLIVISSPKYFDGFLNKIYPKINKNNIIYIPNAIRLNNFKQFKYIPKSILTIGYIGTFRCKEAIKALCETVVNLNKEGYKVNIFFAGMGIESYMVNNYVRKHRFITNYGPYDYTAEISSLYSNVDMIYCVYDKSDNKKIHLSCRYNDAIAFGIPIIIQNHTYHEELMGNNNIGYVLDFGNWNQLRDILLDVHNSSEILINQSENIKNIRGPFVFETYKNLMVEKYDLLN